MTLGKPATGLPRYYMDCGWWRHPSFVGMPTDSLVVFQAIISHGYEHALDGRAPADPEDLAASLGLRLSIVRKGLKPLLERGRLMLEDGHVTVVGWGDHNPTAAEMKAYAADRSEAGAKGNHERWHVGRGEVVADCRWCHPNGDRSSDPTGDRSQESHGMGWDGTTTPQPPAERGAKEAEAHDGSHPNCRACGTTRRARTPKPALVPAPSPYPSVEETAARNAELAAIVPARPPARDVIPIPKAGARA